MAVRFDAAARRAIDLAMIEAERLGHPFLGSLHLLLGVLRVPDGRVADTASGAGVAFDAMTGAVLRALAAGTREEDEAAAEIALERASQYSGGDPVTDLDILLALVEVENTDAARILAKLGLSSAAIRALREGKSDAGAEAAASVGSSRSGEATSAGIARTGIGYDSHRFAPGGPLVLGGVSIPGDVRLVGHSDGDAVAHAVTDAVLGAAGEGDIGELFSDEDPANRGRDSIEMLGVAVDRVRWEGWRVEFVDVVVVTERPKLAPYRAAMCAALAKALGVQPSCVSIKGKTNEGMGWIGRGEGLACYAVATLAPVR